MRLTRTYERIRAEVLVGCKTFSAVQLAESWSRRKFWKEGGKQGGRDEERAYLSGLERVCSSNQQPITVLGE